MRFITMFLSLFIAIGLMAAAPVPDTSPKVSCDVYTFSSFIVDQNEIGPVVMFVIASDAVIADKWMISDVPIDLSIDVDVQADHSAPDQLMLADTVNKNTYILTIGSGTFADSRSPVFVALHREHFMGTDLTTMRAAGHIRT